MTIFAGAFVLLACMLSLSVEVIRHLKTELSDIEAADSATPPTGDVNPVVATRNETASWITSTWYGGLVVGALAMLAVVGVGWLLLRRREVHSAPLDTNKQGDTVNQRRSLRGRYETRIATPRNQRRSAIVADRRRSIPDADRHRLSPHLPPRRACAYLERLLKSFDATLRYLVYLGLSDLLHCLAASGNDPQQIATSTAADVLATGDLGFCAATAR